MGFGDTSNKDKKKAAAAASDQAAKSAAEDASWAENDKGNLKKASRSAAKEDKADAKLAAKKERQELEAAENESTSKLKGATKGSSKVTQAEIARRQALLANMKPAAKKSSKSEVVAAPKIEANTNRGSDAVEATGIDSALSALEGGGAASKKKMTYKEFEE